MVASRSSQTVSLLILLLAAVRGSEGLCSQEEMTAIFSCITPHNQQFEDTFGLSGSCNRTLIVQPVCQSFGQLVVCIKGKQLSAENCLPSVTSQVNPNMGIPCKVEDFTAVCTDVDPFWVNGSDQTVEKPTTTTADENTTTTTSKGGDSGSDAATNQVSWMTSLMTTLLVVMMAAESG